MLDMIKFIVGSFADKPDLAEYIVEEKEKEVNQLLKQFEQTKQMMKQVKNGKFRGFPF